MANSIEAIVMPKWGLAMTEGMLNTWSVEEGSQVKSGDEICEIETTKLANMFECPTSGPLRRRVADEGEVLPVGALIAVVADESIPDADIDAFVTEFQENFVPEETDDGGPEPESIEVDGKKMVYLKMGDAEGIPVLLLHGFGADMNGWLFNQGDLSETATVYALDLPGHGKSVKDVGDGTMESMAKLVDQFTTALSLEKLHLVGHSMGAGVALHLAKSTPAKVASLSLIGPAGIGEEINTAFLEGYIAGKRQKHLKPVLEQLVNDKSLISSDMMEDVLKFKRIDGVPSGLEKLVEANFADGRQKVQLDSVLAEIKVPVTVIWGKGDEIIPSSQASALPESVKVEIIDNSGHVPQMENAAQVNEIIRNNIQAVS